MVAFSSELFANLVMAQVLRCLLKFGAFRLFLRLEVIGHADNYDTLFEE